MACDDRELRSLIHKAWHKTVQVIIQSRDGKPFRESDIADIQPQGLFYLRIEDESSIKKKFQESYTGQSLSIHNPFSLEILLTTKENKDMKLEVWTLFIDEQRDIMGSISSPSSTIVLNRISLLIKSVITATRLTPAWDLSFRQEQNNFCIQYKMYAGEPQLDYLGDDVSTHLVGETNVQLYHLRLQVTYRKNLTFNEPIASPYDPMLLKSDHFKVDSSPKHSRRNKRVSESESTIMTSDESHDSIRPFTNSPLDFRVDTPRSRTSSENSHRGSQTNLSEKIYIPFSTRPRASTESLVSDIPTTNLLIEPTNQDKAEECKQEIRALKERRISESKMPKIKPERNSTQAARSLPKDDEYEFIDMKTPFANSENNTVDLRSFYKEVQHAPELQSFSAYDGDIFDMEEEFKKFDLVANEFDDLVKSFNSESSESLELSQLT